MGLKFIKRRVDTDIGGLGFSFGIWILSFALLWRLLTDDFTTYDRFTTDYGMERMVYD